jgi:hypothetical protein
LKTRLFRFDPVCEEYFKTLKALKTSTLFVMPFIFLISPSGAGKTTFCLNLSARDEFPSLYCIFPGEGFQDQAQTIYKCFYGLSKVFKDQVTEDLSLLKSIQEFPTTCAEDENDIYYRFQSTAILMLKDENKVKFRTVGLIVSLFKELISKRSSSGGQISYIDVQLMIESVSLTPMTIEDGMKELNRIWPNETLYPLVIFFDETSIWNRFDTEKMLLLRSLARCLHIVITFTGTDAKANNFCSYSSKASGLSGDPVPWAIVFNVMPSYDTALFLYRRQVLERKFNGHGSVVRILDYIGKVYKTESPWFVDLCLEFLNATAFDTSISGIELFTSMIHYASDKLINRKNPRANSVEYDDAQRLYLTNFSWNTTFTETESDTKFEIVKSRQLSEGNVHRHMGYLFGFPDSPHGPCFTLYNYGGIVVCMSAKTEQSTLDRQRFDFKSLSVFPSFSQASLTGLVLFGIDLSHNWLVDRLSEKNCTSCFYVAKICRKYPSPVVTGQTLEILTHLAVIQASKTGGPSGCSVLAFLSSLIREFMPVRGIHPNDPTPMIECEGDPCPGHMIPLLSPMATSSWCPPLFNCLKGLMRRGSPLCLGTYRQSISKEPADGVAYFQQTPLDTIEISLPPKESLKILKHSMLWSEDLEVNAPRFAKCFGVKTERDMPNIAFALECKQYAEQLTESSVRGLVTDKFTKYTRCPLFFIISLSMNVQVLNIAGYRSWILKRKPDGVSFELKKLNTGKTHDHLKCLILIPLDVIWGADAGELEINLREAIPS